MGKASDWQFSKRFRRGGFGWRASRLASERIAEALAEIRAAARRDPVHAADGAVRFLAKLTPAHRGVGSKADPAAPDKPATPRHVTMTWAQRLKRVFGIQIDTCTRCGGKLKVIASIEEPEVIAKILAHLEKATPEPRLSRTGICLGATSTCCRHGGNGPRRL